MTLSIIIISWNTRTLLRACLSSIFRHPPPFAFEVIIVDNASSDGSPNLVRAEFPEVRLVENQANLGFATAGNQGAGSAAGRYLLFLNSDTCVHAATLSGAVSYMNRYPQTGIMGCRTLNPDGSLQGSAMAFPTALRIFANVSGLSRFFKLSRLRNQLHLRGYDYVQGSFLIIAKSVFDHCDGFDERFFLYGEDVDLCLRVREAGLRIGYETGISITHHGGGSSENTALRLAHFISGCLLLYEKHRRASQVKKLAKFTKAALNAHFFVKNTFSPLKPTVKKREIENLIASLPAAGNDGCR